MYSIDNDYLWNTAVYFEYFDFWELKSTVCGIGALINKMSLLPNDVLRFVISLIFVTQQ